MTVSLITGAGGFVGSHLQRHLSARDEEVRAVTAGPASWGRLSVLQTPPSELEAALRGVDRLYFLAGIAHEAAAGATEQAFGELNVEAPARWLEAADRAGVARFIWLSSIKVLGDISARPLDTAAPYRPGDGYARSKVDAERRLLATPLRHTNLVVVRPPLVYGPGVRGNYRALLRLAATALPLPLGGARALRSMVSVANLCDLLWRLGSAGAGVYHVADAQDRSVASLLAAMRRLMGRPARQLAVPPLVLRGLLGLSGRAATYSRLFEPLRVDQTLTRTELDWDPPQPADAALQETVEWFLTSR